MPLHLKSATPLRAGSVQHDPGRCAPCRIESLGIGAECHILSAADLDFGLAARRQVDIVLAAPRAGDLPVVHRHASAIHRAGIQLPRALALLHSPPNRMPVPQPQRIEIARPAQHIAPHHRKLAVTHSGQGRIAALADRALGRFVQKHIARPRTPRIAGERAVQALALSAAIVQPGGGQMALGVAHHGVQSFTRRLGLSFIASEPTRFARHRWTATPSGRPVRSRSRSPRLRCR